MINCGVCGAGNVCNAHVRECGGVAFAGQIQPIFTNTCGGAGCHGGVMPAAGLSLAAGRSFASLVNVAASQCANRLRVSPGAPDSSYLMDKLRGVNLCFGTAMPKTGKLPQAQIDLLHAWICEGAPNN
ncbi:MAG: hypothetical protein EXR76_16320 [Myxococcales bacterium]|nr:hypothetical protein [Myxococcales bacterium]